MERLWSSQILVVASLASGACLAEKLDVKFSGFGTLAVTHLDSDKGDYKGSFPDAPKGAGKTQSWSLLPDSRIALQANISYGEKWEVVAQMMSRESRFDDFTPSVEMLNVKYNFDKFTYLRVGRIAHPFFLASDTRLIGYAQPFARGPVEVYGQSQIYHSDAIQLSHRHAFSDSSFLVSAGTGTARYGNAPSAPAVSDEDKGSYRDLVFSDVQWEYGPLLLRLGYTTGINSFKIKAMDQLYAGAANVNPELTNELSLENKRVSFTGLGAVWDSGDYLVQSEYTFTRWGLGEKSIAPNADAYYVLAGKRLGSWLPYAMYGRRRTSAPRIVTQYGVPQLDGAFTAVSASTANSQHTYSLGARWDVRDNMAIKFQLDRMTVDSANGKSYLINTSTNSPVKKGDSFNVLGINLDMVF